MDSKQSVAPTGHKPAELLRSLGTVTASGLHSLGDTKSIQHTANDLVANPGKVANTTTAHEHN